MIELDNQISWLEYHTSYLLKLSSTLISVAESVQRGSEEADCYIRASQSINVASLELKRVKSYKAYLRDGYADYEGLNVRGFVVEGCVL